MASTITASWRTLTNLFAGNMKSRFAWDRDAHVWRELSADQTHWGVVSWEDDIIPLWVGPFPAIVIKQIRSLVDAVPKGHTKKIVDMCESQQWTSSGTYRMLMEACRVSWARSFAPSPPGLVNIKSDVLNMRTSMPEERGDDHDWTWVMPHTIRELADAECDGSWLHFLIGALTYEGEWHLHHLLTGAMKGQRDGTIIHLAGRNESAKRMIALALGRALGPMVATLDDRDTGSASISDDTLRKVRADAVKFILAMDGLGKLAPVASTYEALTSASRKVLVTGGPVAPYMIGAVSIASVRVDDHWTPASSEEYYTELSEASTTREFGAEVLRWLMSTRGPVEDLPEREDRNESTREEDPFSSSDSSVQEHLF